MVERNLYAAWKCMSENNEDMIQVCMQIKKLVDMLDLCIDGILNRSNVVKVLNVYVQSNVFTTEHAIHVCIYFIFFILF